MYCDGGKVAANWQEQQIYIDVSDLYARFTLGSVDVAFGSAVKIR